MENMDYKDEVFKFLFDLRKSGKTNMFGAAPYIQQHFGMESDAAKEILLEWMQNFDKISKRLGED